MKTIDDIALAAAKEIYKDIRWGDHRTQTIAQIQVAITAAIHEAAAPQVDCTDTKPRSVYVASRASLPERPAMWRRFRDEGHPITSTWIDEAGEGETNDFGELWQRIVNEIAAADALVLYAESGDFPLKGAHVEAGIALGMGKPVHVCLPDVCLSGESCRPIGSWIRHPLVRRCDDIETIMQCAAPLPAPPKPPGPWECEPKDGDYVWVKSTKHDRAPVIRKVYSLNSALIVTEMNGASVESMLERGYRFALAQVSPAPPEEA